MISRFVRQRATRDCDSITERALRYHAALSVLGRDTVCSYQLAFEFDNSPIR